MRSRIADFVRWEQVRVHLWRKGTTVSSTGNEIVLDSGASEHVVGDRTMLSEVQHVQEFQGELWSSLSIASEQPGGLS